MPVVIEHLPAVRRVLRLVIVSESVPDAAPSLPPGSLVAGLHERNHDIHIVRPRATPASASHQEAHGVPGAGGRIPALRLSLLTKRHLAGRWNRERPDLVHIPQAGPLGWSALQVARKLHIPVTSACAPPLPLDGGLALLRKAAVIRLRKFHNLAQATIVPDQATRDELAAAGFRNLRIVAAGDIDAFELLLLSLAP